ncbi:conserved hypothetical protein [Ruegeria lacuscaerulensis ITI-1157]|nr:conserved hypothetical protein [Ruegeria lacuscaerulensis ITI-1157]SHK12228.1 F1/F0 ATPase, subunit 2 [Ruegeria lacuscaerulensis ITI-1157]
MIDLDWTGFLMGFVSGGVVGAVYFAGLALSIRLALRAARPTALLLTSSALRITMVLGLGWLAAQGGPANLAGFAMAFLLARVAAIAMARPERGAA